MSSPVIIDTYPEFAEARRPFRNAPISRQVDLWADFYRRKWPEIERVQRRVYERSGVSWRSVAVGRVFPRLSANWRRVEAAHRELLAVIPSADRRVRRLLGDVGPVAHVIHVGIGCGAGWATRLEGRPAVLYGLENVAEAGWTRRGRLGSLVAHELAHAFHSNLRRSSGRGDLDALRGPYFRLYTEGFATEIERLVAARRNLGNVDRDPGWSDWCRTHRGWLARRYLDTVRRRRSVRPFYGSWYRVGGHIETGYWLGAEIVGGWVGRKSLRSISMMDEPTIRAEVRASLKWMAEERVSE